MSTDPVRLFGVLSALQAPFTVLVSFAGADAAEVKRRVEIARRSNSGGDQTVSDLDAEVSFEEASQVLRGLSRGDEALLEASLVITTSQPVKVDEELFCQERDAALPVLSVLGIRRRFHRSHLVRLATACDLVPNIVDPKGEGSAILHTSRGAPLYFSPQDPRLDALHWVVSGATGSGKSFFTGLILKRMLEQKTPMSVLFVDHKRSFRRMVRSAGQPYFEPSALTEVHEVAPELFRVWNQVGTVCGIELSDLGLDERREAMGAFLAKVEAFLLKRDSTHPLYLVLDECWKLMRENPVLVETTFREFRKLNGAVIAITQSFHDLSTDAIGQVIFQCAPIRVILRQGEDVAQYQGILRLNTVETDLVSRLKKVKGQHAECLIKTDFVSLFGRLCPTPEEHELLRTDNLLAELVQEARRSARAREVAL